jgi:hypothetical protein
MSAGSDPPMTLLLSVSAILRLDDPRDAIGDAKAWSEHVGIVGGSEAEVDDVRAFVDELGANPDLIAGEMGGSLADVRQRLRTDRHVLVGTTDYQRSIAAALGWEYKDLEEAAEAAEWELADDPEV